MTTKNEPEFPVIVDKGLISTGYQYLGISERKLAAMFAMQGMISHPDAISNETTIAKFAVKYADALLAELEKTK